MQDDKHQPCAAGVLSSDRAASLVREIAQRHGAKGAVERLGHFRTDHLANAAAAERWWNVGPGPGPPGRSSLFRVKKRAASSLFLSLPGTSVAAAVAHLMLRLRPAKITTLK
jgi:hypothetical protein